MINISKIVTFFNNFVFVLRITWKKRKLEIEKKLSSIEKIVGE
jgi:hypothetical protein